MGAPEPTIELILDVQVDTPGPQAPAAGHSHAISVTRYTVVRVVQGPYRHGIALVGHDQADMSSPEFRRGVYKQLALTSTFPPYATQFNPFAQENPGIPVYYCVTSRLITPGERPN